jgi:FERM C-terminal PH-like domain
VENVFGFNMASYRSCKNLWKSCVEYHTFFCNRSRSTAHTTDDPKHDIMDISYRFSNFLYDNVHIERFTSLLKKEVTALNV